MSVEPFTVTPEMTERFTPDGLCYVPRLSSYEEYLRLTGTDDSHDNFVRWSQISYTYLMACGRA